MKKLIVNTLATTGLALVILGLVATLFGARFLFVSSIFETLLACTLIHLGLLLTSRFESPYYLLETLLDLSLVLVILISFGFRFGWYTSTPLWLVAGMGVGIYAVGCLLDFMRLKHELKAINEALKQREEI